ncbi:MAG: hypothetical protein PHU25_03000 [Deltaproteobacteria bacterium]|nr:hypothetical protein [Deltaproteobacteria bacterium]
MRHKNKLKAARAALLAGVLAGAWGLACHKPAEECPDPAKGAAGKKARIERRNLGRVGDDDPNADWCRACVMGPKGFASCQRALAESPAETKDVLRAKARDRACKDSGFTGECPDKAVIGMFCKGDQPPKDGLTPGKALQQIYFGPKGSLAQPGDGAKQAGAPKPE